MRNLITLFCFLLTNLLTYSLSSQENWLASSQKIPWTILEEVSAEKATNIHFPFQLNGGLILVDAFVNDQQKPFLLDSGAPNLLLNGSVDKESAKFSAVGMNGTLDIAEKKVKQFRLGHILQHEVKAFQLDIGHLEKAKSCEMGGIIGYDQLKEHEILIDYQAKQISIAEPGQDSFNELYDLQECIPFQLKGHFAVISVLIDGKTYYFGIDTGAEANVLNKKLYGKLKRKAILESHKIAVRGIDKNQMSVRKCLMRNIVIEGKSYAGQEFVFSDLKHLNKAYDIQLDGLLGYPFLKDHLYSLNYQNGELCFWQRKQIEAPIDIPMTYHKDR